MIVKGKLIDITRRQITPKTGQTFTAYEKIQLLIKESDQRSPERVTCYPEQMNGAEIGKNIELPVYVKVFGNSFELRVQS